MVCVLSCAILNTARSNCCAESHNCDQRYKTHAQHAEACSLRLMPDAGALPKRDAESWGGGNGRGSLQRRRERADEAHRRRVPRVRKRLVCLLRSRAGRRQQRAAARPLPCAEYGQTASEGPPWHNTYLAGQDETATGLCDAIRSAQGAVQASLDNVLCDAAERLCACAPRTFSLSSTQRS